MSNNGAISATFDGLTTTSYTIPSGYTSGGTVSLDNTIDNEVDEQADLIAQIKSAVDELPEAGGSVSVETCTITCIEDGPNTNWVGSLYYVDKNSELCMVSMIGMGEYIELQKNSIIFVDTPLFAMSGSCIIINRDYSLISVFITGDCTITANA